MDAKKLPPQSAITLQKRWGDLATLLGILLGTIMPMLAAFIYPTYIHHMVDPFYEWTRLQEVPFVMAEIAVVIFAMSRGMEFRNYLSPLKADIKIAFAILIVGLFASSLFVSKQALTSIVISMTTLVHLAFGVSVYHLMRRSSVNTVSALSFGLALGLPVLTFLTAWKFLLPPPTWSIYGGVIEWHAALPGFISVRHFGSWTGAVAALFAGSILARKRQGPIDWRDLSFFLAMGLTIWSGTRAATLAIGVACLFQLVVSRHWPSLHTVGRLSILTGLAAISAWIFLPTAAPEFRLFQSASEYASVSSAGSGRVELWTQTLDRWLEAPIFGWGSGSTFWEVDIGWAHTQPHNFVLQFLISWGFVGACAAFWLLGRSLKSAHDVVATQQAYLAPLLTCLYALLCMACLEGMLHYPRFIMLIVALLAIILKLGSEDRATA